MKQNGDIIGIYVDDVLIAHAQDSTLSITQDAIDATTKDSQKWAGHLRGNRSWEASGSNLQVFSATISVIEIIGYIINSSNVTIKFKTDDATLVIYTGNVDATSASFTASQNSPAGFDFTFMGNGPLEKSLLISSIFDVFNISDSSLWDAETGVTTSGSDVDSVTDQGGMARDLTGVTSQKPVLITDSDGVKAFRFTTSSFSANFTNYATGVDDYLIIFVLKDRQADVPVSTDLRLFNMTNGTKLFAIGYADAQMPVSYQALANAGSASNSNNGAIGDRLHVVGFDWSDANGERVFVNGVNDSAAVVSYTQQILTTTGLAYFGSNVGGSAKYTEADIYEIIVVKGTYTDVQKGQVYDFLLNKYSNKNQFAFVDNGKTIQFVEERLIISTIGAASTEDYIWGCTSSMDEADSITPYRIHTTYSLSSDHNNSPADQRVMYIHSDDDGRTFSTPVELIGILDPNKPTTGGVWRTPSGRLLHKYHIITATSAQSYIKYSDDNGSSWNDITGDGAGGLLTDDFPDPGQITGPGKPYNFGGDIYIPLYGRTLGSGNRECVLYKSTDDGDTWVFFSQIAPIDFDDYEEPHVVNNDGMLIALLRSDPRNKTYIVYSWDGGTTWSQQGLSSDRPTAFVSVGYNGASASHSKGVLSYGRDLGPNFRTQVHYSADGGFTYTTQNGKRDGDYMYGNQMWSDRIKMFIGVHAEEDEGSAQGVGPSSIYSDRYREI